MSEPVDYAGSGLPPTRDSVLNEPHKWDQRFFKIYYIPLKFAIRRKLLTYGVTSPDEEDVCMEWYASDRQRAQDGRLLAALRRQLTELESTPDHSAPGAVLRDELSRRVRDLESPALEGYPADEQLAPRSHVVKRYNDWRAKRPGDEERRQLEEELRDLDGPPPPRTAALAADDAGAARDERRQAVSNRLAHRRFRDYLRKSVTNYTISWLRQRRHEQLDPEMLESIADHANGEIADSTAGNAPPDLPELLMALAEELDRLTTLFRQAKRELSGYVPRHIDKSPVNSQLNGWKLLEVRVIRPLLLGEAPPSSKDLQERYGFKTPHQVDNVFVSLNRCLQRVAKRQETRPTCSPEPDDIQYEKLTAQMVETYQILANSLDETAIADRLATEGEVSTALALAMEGLTALLDEELRIHPRPRLNAAVSAMRTLHQDFTETDLRECWKQVLDGPAPALLAQPAGTSIRSSLSRASLEDLKKLKDFVRHERARCLEWMIPEQIYEAASHLTLAHSALLPGGPYSLTTLTPREMLQSWTALRGLGWVDDSAKAVFADASRLLDSRLASAPH